MRFLFLACSVVLVPVCLQQETSPIVFHQPEFSPEPPVAYHSYRTFLNRKTRKIFDLKLGRSSIFKQTALNLISGSGRGTRPPPPATVVGEVPQFNRSGVSLEIDGYTFNVISKIADNSSKVLGDYFLNTLDRIQQLVEAAKPYIAAKLGLDISASSFTTPEPIESLVPRLGPPLGGVSPDPSPLSTKEASAKRIAPGSQHRSVHS